MKPNFKVSVCMITYGHENFIEEAINGVLMQECEFEIELVISNDCSFDKTDIIVNKIIETNPKGYLIKYYRQKNNLGIMANFLFALNQCNGKYIAMCEGDDYWITKDKLKKQVAILNCNKEVGLVYTNVKHFIQNTKKWIEIEPRYAKEQHEVIPLLLKSKFIEFPTTLFRKSTLDKIIHILRNEIKNKVIGDTRILLETAYNSEIYFLNEVTTVYRILEGSASHPKSIDNYIYVLKDSYICRKTFVRRNNLKMNWLSDAICNTNRGLINNAFISKKYRDTLKLLKNILILDTIKYCKWNVFKKKITINIWLKLILSIVGIGMIRQRLR